MRASPIVCLLVTFAGFALIGLGSHNIQPWLCIGIALSFVVFMAAKKRRDLDI